MAKANSKLVEALRDTAVRLEGGARYEWGHMGRCNCGHLVQTLTQMTDTEIVRSIEHQTNEWSEHAKEYCPGTGSPMEELFDRLQQVGFDREDVKRLEFLSDREVLEKIEPERARKLRRNQLADVTLYMNTMADLLEDQLTATR